MSVVIKVNGVERAVNASTDTPLLYVLRNEMHLRSPHFGCGLAQCGACAVLVDGREVRSCVTPIAAVAGKTVTTVEGLPELWEQQQKAHAPKGALHPVQQAWIDEQVPQCGYCQSGMMIAAVELLSNNAKPTVEQIKERFANTPPSPHLCRCGTYVAIIEAVQRASKEMASNQSDQAGGEPAGESVVLRGDVGSAA
jgi:aerobic-type carbon monoxide dehydrogenase small subunit (CoxS/CutS family)